MKFTEEQLRIAARRADDRLFAKLPDEAACMDYTFSETFEQNMARLEQIVRAMERGDVPLEESLKLFQEGTELVRSCQKLLDEAQLQVKKIMVSQDGTPVEGVFEDEI